MLIAALVMVCNAPAMGQTSQSTDVAMAKAVKTKKSAKKSAKKKGSEKGAEERRNWTFFASLSNVFDSNIEHDPVPVRSFGLVPALGVSYRNEFSRNTLALDYEMAAHSYTHTDRWDVVSHNLDLAYRRALPHHLSSETGAGVSVRGSSEDRELNNQYSLSQRFGYRFNKRDRVAAFVVYRLKRHSEDPGSDAVSPYVGGKYERTLGANRTWAFGYRYEMNRARNQRQRYIRSTFSTDFTTPLGRRDQLSLGARYKPQLYARLVKVGGVRVPRHDRRWVWDTEWAHTVSPNLAMSLGYQFEKRTSNDPDKRFNAHFISLTFRYNWFK
jgi:hypothetical protein